MMITSLAALSLTPLICSVMYSICCSFPQGQQDRQLAGKDWTSLWNPCLRLFVRGSAEQAEERHPVAITCEGTETMQWRVRQKELFYCQYLALQGAHKARETYTSHAEITQPTPRPRGESVEHLQGPQTRHHQRQGHHHRGLCSSNRSAFADVTALMLGTLYAKVLIRPVTHRARSVLSDTALPGPSSGLRYCSPTRKALRCLGTYTGHLLFWRHCHQFSPGNNATSRLKEAHQLSHPLKQTL